LQFGYDKISYASALLSLEKTSLATHTFVLGAAGKRNLLTRIEKIVGIEKKIAFRFNHFAGFMGALFCILIFNSLLIITKEKNTGPLSFNSLENPFYFFNEKPQNHFKKPLASKAVSLTRKITYEQRKPVINDDPSVVPEPLEEPIDHAGLMPVALNEAEVKLSKEQKDHVKETIENTKKVLSTFQWKEVEKTIGNDLTSREKAAVKQEYLREINKIDWVNMEKNLKTAYDNINWPEIDANIHKALASIRLVSLQINYEIALKAIDKAKEDAKANVVAEQLLLPDASLAEIEKCREQVREHINEIRRIRTKVDIKL
jgi:hypothetical protein